MGLGSGRSGWVGRGDLADSRRLAGGLRRFLLLCLRWPGAVRRGSSSLPAQVDRETRIRQAWEASREFLAASWGRNDLETLRLLCLNLAPDQILGARLAARLKAAISAILGRATERLESLTRAAADIGMPPKDIQKLAEALRILDGELQGVVCRAGEPPPFDGPLVAVAAADAVAACDALHRALEPLLVADLHQVIRDQLEDVLFARVRSGELLVHISCPSPLLVAARPGDLHRAVARLLHRVFIANRLTGPVRLSLAREGEFGHLALHWSVVDRFHLDPPRLFESLRLLASYGARLAWNEEPETSSASLDCWLPLVSSEAGMLRPDAGAQA